MPNVKKMFIDLNGDGDMSMSHLTQSTVTKVKTVNWPYRLIMNRLEKIEIQINFIKYRYNKAQKTTDKNVFFTC
jgi:hypothetical protein